MGFRGEGGDKRVILGLDCLRCQNFMKMAQLFLHWIIYLQKLEFIRV